MNIEMIRAAAQRLEGQARRTPWVEGKFYGLPICDNKTIFKLLEKSVRDFEMHNVALHSHLE